MDFLESIPMAEWVLNVALRSIAVLALGRLFLFVFRRKTAPLRSSIGLVTLLLLAAVPFLSLPSSIEWGQTRIEMSLSLPLEVESGPASISEGSANPEAQLQATPPAAGGLRSSPGAERRPVFPFLNSASWLITAINICGVLWGLGLALLILRLVYGILSLRKIRGAISPVSDPRIESIQKEAAQIFGTSIPAAIFDSPNIPTPMALGLFRPLILLPRNLIKKLSYGDVRSILLHEFSHIVHHDYMTGILQRIVTAMNWWNPLSYSLSREISRAREDVSDNHVLREHDSKSYAECLVALAEKTVLGKRLPMAVAMASPQLPLKDRVKNILSKERNMETHLNKRILLIILLAACLLIGGIGGYKLTFAAAAGNDNAGDENPALRPIETSSNLAPEERRAQDSQQAVQDVGQEVRPPKLVTKVEPVFPPEAKEEGLEGVVVLDMLIDTRGNVESVKVLTGKHDLFNEAAVDAVKQWKYEPMLIDGVAQRFNATVSVRFRLQENTPRVISAEKHAEEKDVKAPVSALGDIKPPKLIKFVEPVYPPDAKEAGIEGVVIIEATTDTEGIVKEVRILRSIPVLDQAALDAVKQWIYEPMEIDGEPRGIVFTVTVRFQIDKKNGKV